ncbi:hypothetical protein [Parenemella sanctibonifatiensis]|uniref:ATP synthase subunit I n=1 Tax=Parenemella sanctibonifatiensis TaxID=2016505 RepID=A0A255EHC8_9ACTN|nr:hypothetical protein [Parenemella sanctibonifatiensis]OYN90949.1 hypothetical protein CGZ91_05580 [Parenemella sanctibonifatiensis]
MSIDLPGAAHDTDAGVRAALRPVRGMRERLTTLFKAGLIGGHAMGIMAVGLSMVIWGGHGLASAGLAAATTVLFFTIGHLVQLLFVNADPRTQMVAGLSGYGIRVGGLAIAFIAYQNLGSEILAPYAVALGAVATAIGWVTTEVLAFRQLRIPAYDEYLEDGEVAR